MLSRRDFAGEDAPCIVARPRTASWVGVLARLLLLASLFAVLPYAPTSGSPDAAGSTGSNPRGAVLLLLDTVRADHLSTYGYALATSPHLDALAERGVVFDQAVSYAAWTLPSVAALLSGRFADRAYDPGARKLTGSLVERFRAAGFSTAAFTEGGYFSRHFGLAEGFSEFREEEGAVQLVKTGQGAREASGSIDRTFAAARRWLGALEEGERFFLLIHTYEPHTPYTSRRFAGEVENSRIGPTFDAADVAALQSGRLRLGPEDLRYVTSLYDGDIFETDRRVGELMAFLDETGLAAGTLVVATSDHGEELGDHYPANAGDHGHSLRDDLLRIPLVVAAPPGIARPRRVAQQVQLIDVLPTIADLLGVPTASSVEGKSLVPLMRGEEMSPRLAYGGSATKVGPRRSYVRHLGLKYIEITGPVGRKMSQRPPFAQLYDLRADPGETRNLVDVRPDLARPYEDWLAERLRGRDAGDLEPAAESLPEDLRERLRSLGYVE